MGQASEVRRGESRIGERGKGTPVQRDRLMGRQRFLNREPGKFVTEDNAVCLGA
jgi:hypothetical protein